MSSHSLTSELPLGDNRLSSGLRLTFIVSEVVDEDVFVQSGDS